MILKKIKMSRLVTMVLSFKMSNLYEIINIYFKDYV